MSEAIPNFCPNCGKNLQWLPGDRRCICTGCGHPVVAADGGPIRRFLRRLFGPRITGVPTGQTRIVRMSTESREFRVQDSATGEIKVYHRLEDMPPEVRERIEALRAAESPAASAARYTFRDSSGEERTYHSLEEMPLEVREMFERGRRP